MKYHIMLISVSILLVVNGGAALFSDEAQLVEHSGKGSVNWSKGLVQATGVGAPPRWAYGKEQASPLALTKARMVAYKNLLKVVQGIRIDSKTTVKDFIVADNSILTQLDNMVRGAEVIKKENKPNGNVEVTAQMSLKEGFAQLVLPGEIQHVEPVKVRSPVEKLKESTGSKKPDAFTGLIVDARGLKIQPVIAPKISNENRKEVYGSAYVSREHAVQQGMCGYYTDIDKASADKRVGSNPLVVKGIKTDSPENTDIIISNADASILKSAPENLSFLRKCSVIIIVD